MVVPDKVTSRDPAAHLNILNLEIINEKALTRELAQQKLFSYNDRLN
jgi:hypothetical protein